MSRRKKDTMLQLTPIFVAILIAVAVGVFFYNMGKNSAAKEAEMRAEPTGGDSWVSTADMVTKYPVIEPETFDANEIPHEAEEPAAPEVKIPEETLPAPATESEDNAYDTSDEFDIYRVTEEWLKSYGGMVLVRDGVFYAIDGRVPGSVISRYGFGYNVDGQTTDVALLYMRDMEMPDDVLTSREIGYVSAGDFPILKVRPDDEVRYYSVTGVPASQISMRPMNFYGNTIMAIEMQPYYAPLRNNLLSPSKMAGGNPGVFSLDDVPVDDVRKLEYGKEYKYVYYTNTTYHEEVMEANCRAYTDGDGATILQVTMTKNGYATIDMSLLEPGLYRTFDPLITNVFEIIE